MNHRFFTTLTILAFSLVTSVSAQRSAFNNDPEVVYLADHLSEPVIMLTASPTDVYGDKKANRRLGAYAKDTKLELLAIGKHAYQVKGQGLHSVITGWVNPKLLASKDKDFIANFKKLYERQLAVQELIDNEDVAIGMTLKEVSSSLGEPTETTVKQTREGITGDWSYIVKEEQKHYRYVYGINGQVFRQLSHVTTEEKQSTTLEFENSVVTAITRKKNNGAQDVKIVPVPVHFRF